MAVTATPQIRILYDRRKKASSTVRGSVEIEIIFNGQRTDLQPVFAYSSNSGEPEKW